MYIESCSQEHLPRKGTGPLEHELKKKKKGMSLIMNFSIKLSVAQLIILSCNVPQELGAKQESGVA
jgi:hypothetical protein